MKHDYSVATTSHSRRPRRPIEIMMTPMIDVIFLLLVFFLATSSFQVVEKLLPSGVSNISESSGNAPAEPQDISEDRIDQVIVRLELQGKVAIAKMNGVALANLSELKQRLQEISAARADVPVVIDPAPEVLIRDVVRAYDWARVAGLSRVFLATRP